MIFTEYDLIQSAELNHIELKFIKCIRSSTPDYNRSMSPLLWLLLSLSSFYFLFLRNIFHGHNRPSLTRPSVHSIHSTFHFNFHFLSLYLFSGYFIRYGHIPLPPHLSIRPFLLFLFSFSFSSALLFSVSWVLSTDTISFFLFFHLLFISGTYLLPLPISRIQNTSMKFLPLPIGIILRWRSSSFPSFLSLILPLPIIPIFPQSSLPYNRSRITFHSPIPLSIKDSTLVFTEINTYIKNNMCVCLW